MTNSIYPDNIIGIMFRILDGAMYIANLLVENLMRTPSEIINNWLENEGLPDWLVEFLDAVVKWNSPLTANITLFDLLIGSALIIVLVFGTVKFFTNVL